MPCVLITASFGTIVVAQLELAPKERIGCSVHYKSFLRFLFFCRVTLGDATV